MCWGFFVNQFTTLGFNHCRKNSENNQAANIFRIILAAQKYILVPQ